MSREQVSIPTTIIRGGTSRGIYILESDLPEDRSLWGPYLIELFGSRSGRQIDGLGGADPTTSKCCIIGPNPDPDLDVTYTFAQVGIGEEKVYWDMNCGNLIASVGTFAILAGLVEPQEGITPVRVFQTNTRKVITVEVPVVDGEPLIDGDLAIGGVPGTGAPVGIDFARTVGASLDRGLFPTGSRRDVLDVPGHGPLEVTIMDLANMCVFFRAADLGFTGVEGTERGVDVAPVFHRVREAARVLLGVEPGGSTPWPVSIAPRQDYPSSLGDQVVGSDSHDFVARFSGIPSMRDTIHQAFPGTGASCLSVAAVTPGTIVNEFYAVSDAPSHRDGVVNFGHPTGMMTIEAAVDDAESPADVAGVAGVVVRRATSTRTVRLLMEGRAYLRRSEIARLERELPRESHTRAAVPEAILSGVAAD